MVQKISLRSAFNYDTDKVSRETGLECLDESMTQQHQKEEADINTIVKKFGLTGELPTNIRTPQYGDFTGVTDYQTALNTVMAAQEAFMALPADLRLKFQNDPQVYLDFCENPANLEEMVKLGLAVRKEPAAPAGGTPPKPKAGKTGKQNNLPLEQQTVPQPGEGEGEE